MNENSLNKYQRRSEFIRRSGRYVLLLPLGYFGGVLVQKTSGSEYVWQIDPYKCTQCGRCETHCVLTPSASKCYHTYEMCGYCDLCSGYLRQGVKNLNTAAENQLCPTGAIIRTFIEDPYFEYRIDKDLCIGCARCVKGCADFGNGSLYMQIDHGICVNCNDCALARACPSEAISRVPASSPYIRKDGYNPAQ